MSAAETVGPVKTTADGKTEANGTHEGRPESSAPHNSGDWPYACGFPAEAEQHETVELPIEGKFPDFARGTLYRMAPSIHRVDTKSGKNFSFDHWFDALAIVHRFRLETAESDPSLLRIWYKSRRTADEVTEKIRETGKLDDFTFANKRDPCESFFRKVMTTFKPASVNRPQGKSTVNIGVAFTANMPGIPASSPNHSSHSTKIASLVATSDQCIYQRLDPDTLEPIGLCNMTTLHPELKGPIAAAHAQTDPVTGNVYNFNLEFGPSCIYRIFEASPSTGKAQILAKWSGDPAYIHSMLLTPSTVVLCLWNSRFTMKGISVLLKRNILDSLTMDKAGPAKWVVIDRTTARRGIIATYTSDPFFCFHTVNAYEEVSPENPNQVDIVADLIEYEDMSVIHGFYYSKLVPPRPRAEWYKTKHPNNRYYFARYRLPRVPLEVDESARSPSVSSFLAVREAKAPYDISPELPTINPHCHTKKHRYVYGVRSADDSAFIDGLVKYDTRNHTASVWSEFGQTPGEAIFIADPNGSAEDDGVLLTVVLDGLHQCSYLLCLDARDMKELGRATVPILIAHGLHNLHIPE